MSEESIQRAVLLLLAKATEPMSNEQLRSACGNADYKTVASRISNLVRDGAVVRHHNASGVLTYSFNRSWRPKRDRTLAEALNLELQTKGKKPPAGPGKPKPAPSALPAVSPPRPAAPPAMPEPTPKPPKPSTVRVSCGLLDRCRAVSVDIEDLVGDACDAKLDHDLIKALVTAQGAIQRAERALAA